jgi:hypothetical protein
VPERVKTAKVHFNSIGRQLDTIDRQCAQWRAWIRQLPEAQQADANLEYDEYAALADNYVAVGDRARALLDQLDEVIIRNRTSRSTASHSSDPEEDSDDGGVAPPAAEAQPHQIAALHAPVVLGHLRLPKWKLPTFAGDPKFWRAFWQAFEAAIHNQRIPPVQKLTYLISMLKGEPLKDIQGLRITNENYAVAIRILNEKYGKDEDLAEELQLELQDHPPTGQRFPGVPDHPVADVGARLPAAERDGNRHQPDGNDRPAQVETTEGSSSSAP